MLTCTYNKKRNMNFVEISSKIHYALRRAQEMLNHFHFIKKLAQNVSTGNDTIYWIIAKTSTLPHSNIMDFVFLTKRLLQFEYIKTDFDRLFYFTVVLLLCLLNRSRIETTCQYCNTFVSFTSKVHREV